MHGLFYLDFRVATLSTLYLPNLYQESSSWGGGFFYPKDLSNKLHKKKTNIKPQTGHHLIFFIHSNLMDVGRYVARERETKKQVNNR